VIASRQLNGSHLRNTDRDGLSLGGHDDDLLVELDVGFVTEETGDHELGTVADGVDGRVLDDDALVAGEEGLERADDAAEVGLYGRREPSEKREGGRKGKKTNRRGCCRKAIGRRGRRAS
jgi:hypothetical protein